MQATGTVPTASPTHPVLIVFDDINQMSDLTSLMNYSNMQIVVISKNCTPLDQEIACQLQRSCKIVDVGPLSILHTIQRIVHSMLSGYHLSPSKKHQNVLEKLAQFTCGSPYLIDMAVGLFLSEMNHDSQNLSQDAHDTLVHLSNILSLHEMRPSTIEEPKQNLSHSRQVVTTLVHDCSLNEEEEKLLFAMSVFSSIPIPMTMVTKVSSIIMKASKKLHISTKLHSNLLMMQLVERYPPPVILHHSLSVQQLSAMPVFVYIPPYMVQTIWKDMMSDRDKVLALKRMHMALHTLTGNLSSSGIGFLRGLNSYLNELEYELMGVQCYQETHKLYNTGTEQALIPNTLLDVKQWSTSITYTELISHVGISADKLNQPCSDEHIKDIALFLTNRQTVATYLGLTEIDVEDVEEEGTKAQDKRYKVLRKWKAKNLFKATYRRLVDVFLKIGRADLAEKVCRLLTDEGMYKISTGYSFLNHKV